jgi:predicted GH43/DUF377 family glycosyl hydrolase
MKIYKKVVIIVLTTVLLLSLTPVLGPFSPALASPDWTKDANNPVYTRGVLSGAPCVIYDTDTGTYKMWYTNQTGDPTTLETRVTAILTLSLGTLINDLKNRNFNGVAVNNGAAIENIVQYLDDLSTTDLQNLVDSADSTISYATSTNGITWQYQSVALPQGTAGQWDRYFIGTPSVIKNSTTSYEMWYTGASTDVAAIATLLDHLSDFSAANISTLLQDLVNTDLSAFITHAAASPIRGYLLNIYNDIINILNNTTLAIGHATSTDGITWTKDAANPVLNKGTGWDKYGVATPSVIRNSASDYHLWYTGIGVDYTTLLLGLLTATSIADVETTLMAATNVNIGHATYNGVTWTKDATNPVLSKGTGNVWDKYGVGTPSVLRDSSGYYHMWYTGAKAFPDILMNYITGTGSLESALISGTNSAIGHATSLNGASWTKDATNPILSKGAGAAWDKYGVATPSVSIIGDFYHMWYTGATSTLNTLIQNILDGVNINTTLVNSSTRVAIGHAYTLAVTPPTGGGGGGGAAATPPSGTTRLTTVIDASGTILQTTVAQSDDGRARITLPANTKARQANGQPLTEITMVQSTLPASPPPNISVVGLAYNFGPSGATFVPPVTLTFTYDPALLPPGTNESTLYIAQYDATVGAWIKLPCIVDTVNHTITAQISGFSYFTIQISTRPAAFTTSALTISPAEVNIGGKVNINLTVTNTGDVRGTYKVNLKINNAVVESKDVTLAGGASQSVTFTPTGTAAGTYTVSIDSLSGTFKVTAPPAPAPPTPAPPTPAPPAPAPPTPAPPAPPSAPPTAPTPAAGFPWWAWVVIGVVVVVVVYVIWMVVRRRRA